MSEKMDEDSEKKRAYFHANYIKNKEKKLAQGRAYREKNKEKIKLYKKEYQQKNKEAKKQYDKKYAKENTTRIKKYQKEHHQKKRFEVLAKIDPAMKCAMCGCDDTRFLEINHIEGGGRKEQQGLKKTDHNVSTNFVMLIHKGKRGVEDLNLLCRVCNSIDHLERVYGKIGLRTVWNKQAS